MTDQELLDLCNDALGTEYQRVEDISDAELRRAYILCKIGVILAARPDLIEIVECRPTE